MLEINRRFRSSKLLIIKWSRIFGRRKEDQRAVQLEPWEGIEEGYQSIEDPPFRERQFLIGNEIQNSLDNSVHSLDNRHWKIRSWSWFNFQTKKLKTQTILQKRIRDKIQWSSEKSSVWGANDPEIEMDRREQRRTWRQTSTWKSPGIQESLNFANISKKHEFQR